MDAQRETWSACDGDSFTPTVTGASTLWTLLSSINISLALSQRLFTSDSFKYSHFFSLSICSSRSEMDILKSYQSLEVLAMKLSLNFQN